MKQKQIIGLGVAAVLLMAVAVFVSQSRKPVQEAPSAGPLAAGLQAQLNALDSVVVRVAGGETITLKRVDSTWIVPEKHAFPADIAKLRELLLNVAQARRIEPKTAVASSYPVLGVQDIDAEGASNVLLQIGSGASAVEVILGQNNSRGVGTFVRLKGEAQSWLVDRNLAAERTAGDWLRRDLLDIAANRITSIKVQPDEGDEVQIQANTEGGEGEFRLAYLPAGRELASAFVVDATAGVLSGLRLDDVQPAAGFTPDEGSETTKASFETREGINLDLEAWTLEGETWARIAVSLDQAAADQRIEGEQAREAMAYEAALKATQLPATDPANAATDGATPADGAAEEAPATTAVEPPEPPLAVSDAAADRAERLNKLQAEVSALQATVDGWVFKLPASKAESLRRSMDAYLKPKA
jgi:hypothetical protein